MKKEYFVKVGNELQPVSKEWYRFLHKSDRREKYLEERDEKQGLIFYHSFDSDILCGEDLIVDEVRTDDEAITNVMIEKLREYLNILTEEERDFILFVFSESDKGERQMAKECGVSQQLLNYRKQVILCKLLKMFEK